MTHTESVNRGVCYCRDCQAYAHALGCPETILDKFGGTDFVATLQQHVVFTRGTEALACLSLTEHGLLRWYASCCNTPIGNTQRSLTLSFVGLVHNCLEHSPRSVDETFGPVRMRANTGRAKEKVATMPFSTFASVVRFLGSLAQARFNGSYKRTPFFSAASSQPVVTPRVLDTSERERAMNAL